MYINAIRDLTLVLWHRGCIASLAAACEPAITRAESPLFRRKRYQQGLVGLGTANKC